MGWFDIFKSKETSKTDNSPELKKGEVKTLLLNQAKISLPDFEFLHYKKGGYTFQRVRKFGEENVYELLNIFFNVKDNNFGCSYASIINPFYIDVRDYNPGPVNPHIDLISTKKGSNAIPFEEAYYFSNGKVETTTKIIEQIFHDYKQYAIPFFDKQLKYLSGSDIIKVGLGYIEKLNVDKSLIKQEINRDLKEGQYHISSIKNENFLELKKILQSVPDQTKDFKKRIPKTTLEFLELYWNT